MTDNDEKRQLELELLAADLKLRRKQEFWETPRNIAILVGVAAAIAAAIGFWLGRKSAGPPPSATPVANTIFGEMRPDQFVDAIQTAGIVVIAAMLVYVVIRLDRTLTAAAREIKSALAGQSGMSKRIEMVERLIWERNEILPTTKLGLTLEEIRARLDKLEGDK